MISRQVSVAALVSVVFAATSEAYTGPCYLIPEEPTPWFVWTTTIDVWITTAHCFDSNSGQVVDFSPMRATQLAQTDLERGLLRALNIWNEESGGSIRLRYAGVTTSCTVANAVVIVGISETDSGTRICPGNQADSHPLIVNHMYQSGTVNFYKYSPDSNGVCSTTNSWSTATIPGASFTNVLVHELGHQVFNIGHPSAPPGSPNCESIGQLSVMTPGGADTRLRNWDLETAQIRFSSRANFSGIYKTTMSSPTHWFPAIRAFGDASPNWKRPLIRMSSMTIRVATPVLGWIYGSDPIGTGGTGQLGTTQYLHGMPNWNLYFGTGTTLSRPVAVTSRWPYFGVPENVLVAYLKYLPTLTCGMPINPHICSIYESSAGFVCYMQSTNGGVNFGAETCTSYYTAGYGLSATYDVWSARYVISWIDDNWNVRVLTVDADYGTQTLSTPGIFSPHGPGLACSGAFGGECLLAYQTADSAGTLGWLKFHINNVGAMVVDSSWNQGFLLYDTPSVAYDADSNLYRLAFTQTSQAIYSYSMTATTGTTWTGTGDIWNSFVPHVSSPAFSTRAVFSKVSKPYAWFVRYW